MQTLDQPIRVQGKASLEEGKEVFSLIVPREIRLVFYAISFFGLVMIVGRFGPPFPVRILVPLSIVSGWALLMSWLRNRAHDRQQGLYKFQDIEFESNGVRVRSDQVEAFYQWDAFSKFKCSQGMVVLSLAEPAGNLFAARSWFRSSNDWLNVLRSIEQHVSGVIPDELLISNEPNSQSKLLVSAQEIRKERCSAEAGFKQKVLALVGLFFVLCVAINAHIIVSWAEGTHGAYIAMSLLITPCALAGIVVVWGLRKWSAWVRKPLTAMSVVGLMLIPFGTILGLLILTAMYAGDEPRLLSREYQAIVGAAPQPKERTSFMTWLILGLLVVLIVSLFIVANLPPELRRPR